MDIAEDVNLTPLCPQLKDKVNLLNFRLRRDI